MTFRSAKGYVMPAMAIRATAALCMALMIMGCSSGRDSNSRPIEPGISADGQPCLTQEQKLAKVKELKKKDSSFGRFAEDTLVRGGGNLLGSLIGLDNAGEYADDVNAVKRVTVKGNAARDSIDTIRTKDCDSESKPPDEQATTNGASAVK